MLDMHCHILPGIDDGCETLEESVEMAKLYVAAGYDKLIATPHFFKGRYESVREHNEKLLVTLNEKLKSENVPLEVYLGNELYYEVGLDKRLKDKTVASMAGSSYVLTEYPMSGSRPRITEFAYSLQMAGFIPIIAHPERYTYIAEDPDILIPYIQKEMVIQMNADSIISESERIRNCAKTLLERQMIHLVATDAHTSTWRKPDPKKALDAIRELVDEDYYDEIVNKNPYRILEDRRLIIREPKEKEEKKSFFGKLFGRGGK